MLNGAEVAWLPVAELFYLKNGYNTIQIKKEFWKGGSIPWFRMDDIHQNGQILDDSLQKITGEAVKAGKSVCRDCAAHLPVLTHSAAFLPGFVMLA